MIHLTQNNIFLLVILFFLIIAVYIYLFTKKSFKKYETKMKIESISAEEVSQIIDTEITLSQEEKIK